MENHRKNVYMICEEEINIVLLLGFGEDNKNLFPTEPRIAQDLFI
jgi:hypothetical protein